MCKGSLYIEEEKSFAHRGRKLKMEREISAANRKQLFLSTEAGRVHVNYHETHTHVLLAGRDTEKQQLTIESRRPCQAFA